jgi:hypothetical protein
MKKYEVDAKVIIGKSTVVCADDEREAARVATGIFEECGDDIFNLEITNIVEIEKEEE